MGGSLSNPCPRRGGGGDPMIAELETNMETIKLSLAEILQEKQSFQNAFGSLQTEAQSTNDETKKKNILLEMRRIGNQFQRLKKYEELYNSQILSLQDQIDAVHDLKHTEKYESVMKETNKLTEKVPAVNTKGFQTTMKESARARNKFQRNMSRHAEILEEAMEQLENNEIDDEVESEMIMEREPVMDISALQSTVDQLRTLFQPQTSSYTPPAVNVLPEEPVREAAFDQEKRVQLLLSGFSENP